MLKCRQLDETSWYITCITELYLVKFNDVVEPQYLIFDESETLVATKTSLEACKEWIIAQ